VPLKACLRADQAEVGECVIFAMRNSLKSQDARELKSPYSNIRAITLKLRLRRGQQQLQITRTRRAFRAPSLSTRRPPDVPTPRFRPLKVFGPPAPVRVQPPVRGRRPKTFTYHISRNTQSEYKSSAVLPDSRHFPGQSALHPPVITHSDFVSEAMRRSWLRNCRRLGALDKKLFPEKGHAPTNAYFGDEEPILVDMEIMIHAADAAANAADLHLRARNFGVVHWLTMQPLLTSCSSLIRVEPKSTPVQLSDPGR